MVLQLKAYINNYDSNDDDNTEYQMIKQEQQAYP